MLRLIRKLVTVYTIDVHMYSNGKNNFFAIINRVRVASAKIPYIDKFKILVAYFICLTPKIQKRQKLNIEKVCL